MAAFVEGVGVIAQACTLVIGLPTLILALTARRAAPWVVAGSIAAAALVMWAKAATWWTLANDGWMVVPIAIGIGAAFVAAARADGRVSIAFAAGVTGGVIAGWMWQPCVGTELGDILNNAETARLSTSVRMVAYTTGALLPAVLLAVLPTAIPATKSVFAHRRTTVIGLGLGAIYALAVLSNQYDDLIGQLSRWSSA